MELYKKIRLKREALGMSQEELAVQLGYRSRSTIAKIEKGENDITQSKITAFAKALRTTPGDLMGLGDTAPAAAMRPVLPDLTVRDERQIARDLENMIDNLSGAAAYNDPDDEEDAELLKASLLTSMRLAKQIAKKKFTPKKYRGE